MAAMNHRQGVIVGPLTVSFFLGYSVAGVMLMPPEAVWGSALRTLLLVVSAMAGCIPLLSCGSDDGTPDKMDFQLASQDTVLGALKDPDSAQFRGVRAFKLLEKGETTYAFCGEVNAKNSLGGYTGYQKFAAQPGTVVLAGETPLMEFVVQWAKLCDPEKDDGEVWL